MERKIRPCRPTEGQLAKVGVELCGGSSLALRCQSCGRMWWPNLLEGGKLPRNYWKCPGGCNG